MGAERLERVLKWNIYWRRPMLFYAVFSFGSTSPLQSACIGKLYLLHREKRDI
jgi:hypothetical protein